MSRQAELAHHQHIQTGVQRRSDPRCYGYPTPRQPKDHHVTAAADVTGQLLGQDLPGLVAISVGPRRRGTGRGVHGCKEGRVLTPIVRCPQGCPRRPGAL